MRLLLVLFMITSSMSLSAQEMKTWDEVLDNLKESTDNYFTSYINEDWEGFASFFHPKVTELAGGEEMMVKLSKESISMYKSLGYDIEKGEITGDIETVDSSEGIQALLPAAIIMSNGDQKIESPMKLYALSSDGGLTWKFVDLSQYSSSNIRDFVPEFSSDLEKYW